MWRFRDLADLRPQLEPAEDVGNSASVERKLKLTSSFRMRFLHAGRKEVLLKAFKNCRRASGAGHYEVLRASRLGCLTFGSALRP